MTFRITDILVNEERNPIGIDIEKPIFSWKFSSTKNSMKQKAVKILVGSTKKGYEFWNSGIIQSNRSIGIMYSGKKLEPCTKYYVTIQVWNEDDESAIGETTFETGFLNESIEAWSGARWIGAPEYYVASDTISVFKIGSTITIKEGSKKAGIVFGANDDRLLKKERNELLIEGENFIRFALNVSTIPATLEIYRVGYDKDDNRNKPFATISVVSEDTKEAIITLENRYEPHKLEVEVTGNCAYTYVDGIRIDSTKRIGFFGEEVSPRQLNPLGYNDTTTFPRLCEIGYYVEAGSEAEFSGLIVRNLRKPNAVIAKLHGKMFKRKNEEVQEVINPSKHSLPMLRCDFGVNNEVDKARLYITCRGIYDCMINGENITNEYFAPGLSQYDKHLIYQTYDVTRHIKKGKNGIGFTLSSGWWSDASTFSLDNYNYWGDKPSLLCKLVIKYRNGSEKIVVSNCNDWQYYGEGPYIYSGFFNGEQYDGAREWIYKDYSKPGFKIQGMKKPMEITPVYIEENKPNPFMKGWPEVNKNEPKLIGHYNSPVRAIEKFTAKKLLVPSKGVYIYDLGQEISGVPYIKFRGKKGTKVRIRYGEMLYPNLSKYGELAGHMLQVNLREASNMDIYILRGDEHGEIFSPKFTFHGYRYIEITGIDEPLELESVQSILLSSVSQITGSIETSDELVNKLISNVKYSQLCNFISIPTDCPQRNERMGWLGDTHVFCRTATYQSGVKNFYLRNLQAIRDLQEEDGRYPNIAPIGGGFGGITYESAMILMVWELYQQYGDKTIINEYYSSMKKWMDSMDLVGLPGDVFVGPLGDWLAPDETDNSLIWNAFYGKDAELMEKFSKIIGYRDEEVYFRNIKNKIREYWNNTFIDKETGITKDINGSINDTQGSYSIALSCGVISDEYKEKAYKHLARKTEECGFTVRTGFFGTGSLNPMLTEGGYSYIAYKLITQREYPSWLYPVTQGATTIWERWDSYTKEEGFGDNNAMNSFNHYSLGSVLSWIYETVLGIKRDEDVPGYGHFYLKPEIREFKYAKGGIETPYGRIESGWLLEDEKITYTCKIPENSTATVIFNEEVHEVGSGRHIFYGIRQEEINEY